MLQQAIQLAHDIGLFMLPRAKHRCRENMTSEMERARAITAWGIFSLNQLVVVPKQRRERALINLTDKCQ
jgi:hypothetical protein